MQAQFLSDGALVDFVADNDIAAGDVIVRGNLVLVATSALLGGEPGTGHARGAFSMQKQTGPGTALPMGTRVVWDDSADAVRLPNDSDTTTHGVTFAAASDGDTHVGVLLGR